MAKVIDIRTRDEIKASRRGDTLRVTFPRESSEKFVELGKRYGMDPIDVLKQMLAIGQEGFIAIHNPRSELIIRDESGEYPVVLEG